MSVPSAAVASSFTVKQLRVTLILEGTNATFPNTGDNTLVLTGLRMLAVIQAVAKIATLADLKIYGMLPADMNALTVVFFNPPVILNQIVIIEANGGNGWVQVFSGTMIEAQPDYRGAPEAFFHIQARVGYYAQINPVAPLSYTGSTDVVTIIQGLAAQMGFTVENNGVTAQLASPYFPGTVYDQLEAVCQHASVDFYFVGNTLAICPANSPRQSVPLVVLSPTSGLLGYPVIERFGISVDCVFNPGVVGGGMLQIMGSDIPSANGMWAPYSITHNLSSVTIGGPWTSTLHCLPVTQPTGQLEGPG